MDCGGDVEMEVEAEVEEQFTIHPARFREEACTRTMLGNPEYFSSRSLLSSLS